jgi:hypothetical protein
MQEMQHTCLAHVKKEIEDIMSKRLKHGGQRTHCQRSKHIQVRYKREIYTELNSQGA